jgi:hypothetical protein
MALLCLLRHKKFIQCKPESFRMHPRLLFEWLALEVLVGKVKLN